MQDLTLFNKLDRVILGAEQILFDICSKILEISSKSKGVGQIGQA